MARYAYVLRKPADDLVHALKYEGWHELADFMAKAMAKLTVPEPPASSLVVPVPTTVRRRARRGYNQAELLARRLAGLLGLPLRHALERLEGERSQTSLAPAERRENVRGVFRPTEGPGGLVRGRHVLLVDDVLTTGATAGEAARTLASVGVHAVTLVTFARALPTRSDRPG